MDLLEKAICTATRYHHGQIDKVGEPYIFHPIRVMLKQESNIYQIAAVLHDILEDTNFPRSMLLRTYGSTIYDAIVSLTRGDGEKWEDYIKRCKLNHISKKIKLDDITDNLNPDRLIKLDKKTRKRLIEKYEIALTILNSN